MYRASLTLFVTSAALSGVGVVTASPHNLAVAPRAVAQIPGYDYEGCWTEAPDNVRALNGSSYFDDYMTVEKCADACTGFKYFGVEYGRECYCGNTLDECSIEADDWECSFACPGDSAQNCGAGDRLDLYVKADTPTPTTYGYRGCYAEPSNARALPNLVTASPDMTVDTCATVCRDAGFSLFGLEYYTECYCGYVLAPGTESAPEAECKFPCAGNPTEKCGGDWHFNLYEFGLASPAPTTTTTSTAVPEPTGPVTYVSEGCYTEATGIRALSDHAYYNDVMTVALCAEACSDYTYFGVEYGRECFCGNAINTDQGSTLTSLSECSFPCPGNPAEKCGAGNRLNVYRNLPPVEQVTITTTTTAAPEEALTTTSVIEETSTTVAPEDALTTTSVVEETSTTVVPEETLTTTSVVEETSTTVVPEETLTTTVVPDETLTTTSVVEETSTTVVPEETLTTTVVPEETLTTTVAPEEPTTSSVEETSTSATLSSTTSATSTEPTSTSTSTSSTTSSTTSTITPPAPTSVLINGNFEGSGGWTIRVSSTSLAYNFANTNTAYDGTQSGSIAYNQPTSSQAWFNQQITLTAAPSRYNFSGFVRASTNNPGCNVYFYIGDASGSSVIKIMSTTSSANIRTTWTQATGWIDITTAGTYTFNVRTTCSSTNNKTYWVDALSLVPEA